MLGDHVAQKGSLVAPDRLRFDFSHPKPMTARGDRAGRGHRQRRRAAEHAGDHAADGGRRRDRASGARALFGEKYGDEVRVVAMGEGGGNTMGWSVELCGGTHVRRTGDIGLISGLSDSGVAAGVRRIEALTGTTARKYAQHLGELAKAASAELKVPLEDMPARLAQVLDERRRLERELSEAKKKLAMGGGARATGADGVRVVGDVKLLARAVEGIEIKDLKSLADEGKKQLGSGVVAIVGVTEDGKAGVVVGVTPDLIARFSAVDLVRKGAEALGGKGGGGSPDMAQAGGPDGSKAEAALAAIAARSAAADAGLCGRRRSIVRQADVMVASLAQVNSSGRPVGARPWLKDVLVFLAAAGLVVPLFHRARIGAVLGFLLVGVAGRARMDSGSSPHDYPWLRYLTIEDRERRRAFRRARRDVSAVPDRPRAVAGAAVVAAPLCARHRRTPVHRLGARHRRGRRGVRARAPTPRSCSASAWPCLRPRS